MLTPTKYYIVHRSDVGKVPKDNQQIVLATWIADGPADIPDREALSEWCNNAPAHFPADIVDENGTLVLRDARFP